MCNLFLCFRHEIINVHLADKPEWYLIKNPFGIVLTLETPAGELIYESPITCEQLDEGYPEKQLLPSSPFAKAKNDAGVFFQSRSHGNLHINLFILFFNHQIISLMSVFQRIGYFYRISSGRKNGQDVSGLEAELKEKLSKLNEVGDTIDASSFFTHKHII